MDEIDNVIVFPKRSTCDENGRGKSRKKQRGSVTNRAVFVTRTPSEKRQRQLWLDAARRLGLHGALGAEIKIRTRQEILASIGRLMISAPEKMSALVGLRELIGERATDAERARVYRERQNPQRAAKRRTTCAVCDASLVGRRADARTCSERCRRVLSRQKAAARERKKYSGMSVKRIRQEKRKVNHLLHIAHQNIAARKAEEQDST